VTQKEVFLSFALAFVFMKELVILTRLLADREICLWELSFYDLMLLAAVNCFFGELMAQAVFSLNGSSRFSLKKKDSFLNLLLIDINCLPWQILYIS
jgi:hypothetical protein